MKSVCSAQARSPQRGLICAHLEETGREHTDLLMHTDVKWLRTGTFLARFTELLLEIKDFLKLSKGYGQLED